MANLWKTRKMTAFRVWDRYLLIKKKLKQKTIKNGTSALFNQLNVSSKILNTQFSKNHNVNLNKSSFLDTGLNQYSGNNSKITIKGKSNNHLPHQRSIDNTKNLTSINKKQFLKRL